MTSQSKRALHPVETRETRVDEREQGYGGGDAFPLGGYVILLSTYTSLLVGVPLAMQRLGRRPKRLRPGEVALLAPAIHKLSRIITKDWVTSPLRAPFVQYEESLPGGEVKESSRGRGLRRAVGDLLTCPYCIGPWVATALVYGMTYEKRTTRTLATIYTLVSANDFLHFAYNAARKRAMA